MTQPGIPEDDPESRHDPSTLGVLSLVSCLAVVGLVAFAWSETLLLAGGITLAAALVLLWLLR